jgi:hypothetical protein
LRKQAEKYESNEEYRASHAVGARTAATALAVRPFVMSRVIMATGGSLF